MKQKATQLIRDNAPWLKELSFGCEVKSQHEKMVVYVGLDKEGRVLVDAKKNTHIYTKEWYIKDIEIIGHPITIGDVLRVIPKKKRKWLMENDETVVEYTVNKYSLTQPFDNQSDEFYAFIVELLGKE